MEGVWFVYCYGFENIESEFFSFKETNLQHVKLKIKSKFEILWWSWIYWRFSIHFKKRMILEPSEILIATNENIKFATNRLNYKFFSVITQLSVRVTLFYFT